MKLSDLNLLDFGHTIQMVGVVYQQGGGDLLFAPLPFEAFDHVRAKPLELTTHEWSKVLEQTDVLNVEVARRAKDGQVYRAMHKKSQRMIDAEISWEVYRRDGFKCRYCGDAKHPMTVDHLVLWEEGGPSVATNLVTACKRCNRARGKTQYAGWLVSDYYMRVSRALTDAEFRANQDLAATLDSIERTPYTRSR